MNLQAGVEADQAFVGVLEHVAGGGGVGDVRVQADRVGLETGAKHPAILLGECHRGEQQRENENRETHVLPPELNRNGAVHCSAADRCCTFWLLRQRILRLSVQAGRLCPAVRAAMLRTRGSKASRSPSPSRFRPSTATMMAKPGAMVGQTASCR